jgi:hypothetical protein
MGVDENGAITQAAIGICHLLGIRRCIDSVEAAEFVKTAVCHLDSICQFNYGLTLVLNPREKTRCSKALKYFNLSADQNLAPSQPHWASLCWKVDDVQLTMRRPLSI